MTTIPDDIMQAAHKAAVDCLNTSGFGDEVKYARVIARALMAERERCAKVAESHGDTWHKKHPFPVQAVAVDLKCEEIATAIRGQS